MGIYAGHRADIPASIIVFLAFLATLCAAEAKCPRNGCGQAPVSRERPDYPRTLPMSQGGGDRMPSFWREHDRRHDNGQSAPQGQSSWPSYFRRNRSREEQSAPPDQSSWPSYFKRGRSHDRQPPASNPWTGAGSTEQAGPSVPSEQRFATPHPSRIDRSTDITFNSAPDDASRAFTIRRRNRDGSQTVLDWRNAGPSGRVDAYRLTLDRKTGAQTMAYPDGRKYIAGNNFTAYSIPKQPMIMRGTDGLKAALMPDGRPIYKDELVATQNARGGTTRRMKRTIFMHVSHGHAIRLAAPIVQNFDMVVYQGEPIYAYMPVYQEAEYYTAFDRSFAEPMQIEPDTDDCANDGQTSAPERASYRDSDDLLADTMLTEYSCDAEQGPSDNTLVPTVENQSQTPQEPVDDAADTAKLNQQLAQLQSDMDAVSAKNRDLETQIEQLKSAQNGSEPERPKDYRPASRPSRQFKKQVIESDKLAKQHKPLSLADIMESSHYRDYEFHLSSAIFAKDPSDNRCVLHSADVIRIVDRPEDGDLSVKVKVETSGGNSKSSCGVGSTVLVTRSQLQDILNDFIAKAERDRAHLKERLTSAVGNLKQSG